MAASSALTVNGFHFTGWDIIYKLLTSMLTNCSELQAIFYSMLSLIFESKYCKITIQAVMCFINFPLIHIEQKTDIDSLSLSMELERRDFAPFRISAVPRKTNWSAESVADFYNYSMIMIANGNAKKKILSYHWTRDMQAGLALVQRHEIMHTFRDN